MRLTASLIVFVATWQVKCSPGGPPGPGWPVYEQGVIDGRIVYGDVVRGAEQAVVVDADNPGMDLQVDLPKSQHIKNFGWPPGPGGKGLCVFCSFTMDARWHHVEELSDLVYWDAKGEPHSKIPEGGGWPEKLEAVVKEFAPHWSDRLVQYEGTDPALLDKALAEGIAVCVTLGYGERYQMQTIYHMVLLVHIDVNVAVILDNNFPGTLEKMPRAEFLKRWIHPTGKGWAALLMAPPPPPIPQN